MEFNQEDVDGFFAEHVPDEWFDGAVTCAVDRDEILVTGRLQADDQPKAFRERTRDERIEVASSAESKFGRKVSWAVRTAETEYRFSTLSVPVMTRLRINERVVLDTLISGGVARSRSEALAWCVRLVAEHESGWITDLQDASAQVDEVRRRGPSKG
jgi:hypothetical protein